MKILGNFEILSDNELMSLFGISKYNDQTTSPISSPTAAVSPSSTIITTTTPTATTPSQRPTPQSASVKQSIQQNQKSAAQKWRRKKEQNVPTQQGSASLPVFSSFSNDLRTPAEISKSEKIPDVVKNL